MDKWILDTRIVIYGGFLDNLYPVHKIVIKLSYLLVVIIHYLSYYTVLCITLVTFSQKHLKHFQPVKQFFSYTFKIFKPVNLFLQTKFDKLCRSAFLTEVVNLQRYHYVLVLQTEAIQRTKCNLTKKNIFFQNFEKVYISQ